MAQATTRSCSTAPATELKTLSPCSVFTAPTNNEPVIKEMDGQLQQMTDGSAGSAIKAHIWLIWVFPNWKKIDLTPTPSTANLSKGEQ